MCASRSDIALPLPFPPSELQVMMQVRMGKVCESKNLNYRVFFTVFSRFFAPPPIRSSSAAWRLGQTMTLLLLSDGGGFIDS